MRDTMARVIVVILVITGAAAAEPARSYVLPTEVCGNYYLVQMRVSGDPGKVLSMLLDTGASYTVIDTESVARVAGKPVAEGRRTRFSELVAGEITFKGLRAKVMQLDHLQRALGTPMDGILGFPAFEDMLLTIDFPAGEVSVRKGSLPAPDGKRILRTVKEKRRPVIELKIGTERRKMLLDTGSSGGILLRDTDGLDFVAAPIAFDSSIRIDHIMVRSGARLAGDVMFAGSTLIQPTVEIGQSMELVGTSVMRHFTATFDQKRRRVLFEGQAGAVIESPPVRDVGWSLRTQEAGFEILRVFEGFGAARAGLRAGDLVVAIDGTPVYEQDLCDRSPEQREEILVTVERDGRRLEFQVPIDTVVP